MSNVTILHRHTPSTAPDTDQDLMWRKAARIAACASIGFGIASGLLAGTITYAATGRHGTGAGPQ